VVARRSSRRDRVAAVAGGAAYPTAWYRLDGLRHRCSPPDGAGYDDAGRSAFLAVLPGGFIVRALGG
jgi:hypothetical protein